MSNKAVAHRGSELPPVNVAVFVTPNNSAVGEQLSRQLQDAADNEQAIGKITPKLEQRKNHPFGFLCTPEGEFNLDAQKYPGISFDVVKV